MEKDRSQHSILIPLSLSSVKEQATVTASHSNQRINLYVGGELISLIHTAWQVHVCIPNKLYLFHFCI